MNVGIKVGDYVLHTISGNYFRCENAKQERWMNMNEYYIKVSFERIPAGYFKKEL